MVEAMEMQEVDPRYPIGKFKRPEQVSEHDRMAAIAVLGEMPDKLKDALAGLDQEQLDTPYREGRWRRFGNWCTTLRTVTSNAFAPHATRGDGGFSGNLRVRRECVGQAA